MTITNGLVTSVQVGIPEPLETSRGVVPSSICRRVLSGRVPVTRLGLAGNEQADLVNHGGADKAVCVYFSHHYAHWESRLGFGLTQGAFGENLTMSGFDETTICIGDVMTVGTVRVEVSQPRQPCYKLASRHGEKQLATWIIDHGSTGFYFRVLSAGEVWAGADVVLEARIHPELTIAFANRVMHHSKAILASADDQDAARSGQTDAQSLLVPELSASWHASIRRKFFG